MSTWQTLARDPKKKIAAIKAYREETGATLVQAKGAVEKYCISFNPQIAGLDESSGSGVMLVFGIDSNAGASQRRQADSSCGSCLVCRTRSAACLLRRRDRG